MKLELKKEPFNNLRIKKALKLMRSVDKDFCSYLARKTGVGSDLRKFLFGRALLKLDYLLFVRSQPIKMHDFDEVSFQCFKDYLRDALTYGYEYVHEVTPYDFRGL